MKFNNVNEMNLDKIVLLGDKKEFKILSHNSQVTQSFYWCYFKDEPSKIICLNPKILNEQKNRTDLDKEILNSKLTIIDLKGNLYSILKRILNKNINNFVDKNINNVAYLFEINKDESKNISLYEIGKDIRKNEFYGLDKEVKLLLDNFKYSNIQNGLIKLSSKSGKKDFVFDMKSMKFECNEIDIFKEVYGLTALKKILAYEQYKKGLTPPYYNEIAKINEFLEDKKNVTILLNDEEKRKVPAQIFYILARNCKEIWLNAKLKNKDINNLRAISYGKKELIVNTENLINIDKQLDNYIDKSKKNDFEIEEIENGS